MSTLADSFLADFDDDDEDDLLQTQQQQQSRNTVRATQVSLSRTHATVAPAVRWSLLTSLTHSLTTTLPAHVCCDVLELHVMCVYVLCRLSTFPLRLLPSHHRHPHYDRYPHWHRHNPTPIRLSASNTPNPLSPM